MRVGLTGGIASGKSVASAELRRLGAHVIDYDQLAREVIAPGTPGAAVVADAFGVAVQGDDGVLDRSALARVAFASDDARLRLESIVHPLVYQAAAEREAELSVPLVVHDIPLLAEVMDPGDFDLIVVVDAPAELRLQRLMDDRGLSLAEATRRLQAQVSDEQRRQIADVIWDGSGPPEHLCAQVAEWLWQIGPKPAAKSKHEA